MKRNYLSVIFTSMILITPMWANGLPELVLESLGGASGARPFAGLTYYYGNFYGTTSGGGAHQAGTVFELTPTSRGYDFTILYTFTGGADGGSPRDSVVFDKAGNLYGTTFQGGTGTCMGGGCGTVFELSPNNGTWTETVIHTFTGSLSGGSDGADPSAGLIFDKSGNLYGTATYGGPNGQGVAFELIPSNGTWSESVIYSFLGAPYGGGPVGGLLFDKAGNLYGTTGGGSSFSAQAGIVFELSPNSGASWTETVLHSFGGTNDGWASLAGLISDSEGNLYGTTYYGGSNNCGSGACGTVFELSRSDGTWTESVIYNFTNADGYYPESGLLLARSGRLYGTTYYGGTQDGGTVYELGKLENGTWKHVILYSFSSVGGTGLYPVGPVIEDDRLNLYGTTVEGGTNAEGVVFELTQ